MPCNFCHHHVDLQLRAVAIIIKIVFCSFQDSLSASRLLTVHNSICCTPIKYRICFEQGSSQDFFMLSQFFTDTCPWFAQERFPKDMQKLLRLVMGFKATNYAFWLLLKCFSLHFIPNSIKSLPSPFLKISWNSIPYCKCSVK